MDHHSALACVSSAQEALEGGGHTSATWQTQSGLKLHIAEFVFIPSHATHALCRVQSSKVSFCILQQARPWPLELRLCQRILRTLENVADTAARNEVPVPF